MAINNDTSALIGFACETFLYGCYTILFAVSIHLMFKHSRHRVSVNKYIAVISVLLYLSCTTHFALEFSHFYTTLTTKGVNGFGDETNVLIGADLLISITDFIGEVILIYRCWLLWSRNYWIIILPSLTAISTLACVGLTLHLLLLTNPTSPMAPPSLLPLGVANFTLPLCTNVLVTTLITVRIWYLSPRNTRDLPGGRFPMGTSRAAIDIVIESGMLYLAVQLVFVILFATQHPAQGIIGVIAVQIYGIAPVLIIIRVSLGMSTTPSGRFYGATGSVSKPVSTQVHVGYSTAAYSDVGQRMDTTIPMPQIKSRFSGEDLTSSTGTNSIENATPV